MSRRRKHRILLVSVLLLWSVLAACKGYLTLFEREYTGLNAQNQEQIQALLDGRQRFSFAVLGNVSSTMKIFEKRIVPLLREGKVDFIISAGNGVRKGTEADYRILHRGLRRSGLPYLLCVGVKEAQGSGVGRFYRHFGPLFFTMEAGGSSFIFLDSTGVTDWGWQMRWLEERLEHSTGARFRFLVLNRPLLMAGDHDKPRPEGALDAGKARSLRNAVEEHGVTAVFSSGDGVQSRQRSRDMAYFTSGSAGGLRLDERGQRYQYLRVDVDSGRVSFSSVEVPAGTSPLVHRMETIAFFLHSLLPGIAIKLLFALGLLGLAALMVSSRIVKQEYLYRDFDVDENPVPGTPLRVAAFTDNYLPYIGGVPISIHRLSRGLLESGSAVKIFAPSYGNGRAEGDDGMVHRCRTVFLGKTMRFPVTNIFSKKLEQELRRFKPDLVHVHHPFWLGGRGRKLARDLHLPVVFTYHTRLDQYVHNVPLPGSALKAYFAHALVKRFANGCDAVIAPSLSTEQYLRRLGVQPAIATIPTGVDIEAYSRCPPGEVSAFRARYALESENLIMSVCRLAREKNVEFMIAGLLAVREKTSVPFRCILVGDGPERRNLERRVAETGMGDTILFTGAMTPEEVVRACLASDLFVFASRTETQGMVLLEAMAGGCPVVAVSASGVHDIIEDGFNGFKVPGDVERWAGSIALLLENRKLLETLSHNSREFAAGYSRDRTAEKVLTLYHRTLLGCRSASPVRNAL